MEYAIWIALAVVFIAVAPAIFRKRGGAKQPDRSGTGSTTGSGDSGSSGRHDRDGNDADGGGDGGGD
jgi:hypothetical protein